VKVSGTGYPGLVQLADGHQYSVMREMTTQ